MQLGAEAVFVGSGIFMKAGATPLDLGIPTEREEAESRAKAIVAAATHYNDSEVLAKVSEQMTGSMKGLAVGQIEEKDLLQTRGW
jgi:pyridoxal 5'-phosphate synthase pdxS subunit